MKTIIKIKTWTCPVCGYQQDFEPTQENQNKHFNQDHKFRLNNVLEGECPSCRLKKISSNLVLESSDNKKIAIVVMGEEELEEKEIEENGKKRKLNKKEKDALRQKIKDDIKKFSAMQ